MYGEFKDNDWKTSASDVFWGEIAPCDHVVQIYDTDEIFLDTLVKFVDSGIRQKDGVIIIATAAHITALNNRLESLGYNTDSLEQEGLYQCHHVEDVLAKFMINGWPDEYFFMQAVSSLLNNAGVNNRKLRVFGEMVALLWAQGNTGATMQLEYQWNRFCHGKEMSLFCAYPKAGFSQNINTSLNDICKCHAYVIDGTGTSESVVHAVV